MIKLIFKNGRTSMLIFLPFHEESDPYLQTLSKDLSYVTMRTLLTSLNETELVLSIPRFQIESKLNLASPLMRVSMKISIKHEYLISIVKVVTFNYNCYITIINFSYQQTLYYLYKDIIIIKYYIHITLKNIKKNIKKIEDV